MERAKFLLSLLLILVMVVSMVLYGCGSGKEDVAAPDTSDEKPAADDSDKSSETDESESVDPGAGVYSQIDLSQPYTVNMYVLGDVPPDMDLVVEEINKILEPRYNTKLDVHFLAWSDYETKYSLILAGGEDVDIMYTSSWCFYYTEAAKGAFMEITDEFLERAMPQTKATQAPESWDQVRIEGKIYAVPRNYEVAEAEIVAIRDDLREKHGLEPLTDWDSLVEYLEVIAERETPESGIWAIAASGGNSMRTIWDQKHQIIRLIKGSTIPHYTYVYDNGKRPTNDDFFLYWDSQYFRDFAKIAKELCDKGCWPEDALTSTVSEHDAFANGQGAYMAWNTTVFKHGKRAEENIEGAKVGYYDLTKDAVVFPMPYVNDCFAIAAASKNPDRAGMVLDLLKNDSELYLLIQGGIEGKHYINIDNEYRRLGPEAERYPWNSFAWGLNNNELDLIPEDTDPRQIELEEIFKQRMVPYPTSGFVFDAEPVKNELAAVDAIRDEYRGMLELGLVDDPDATIDEMVSRMMQAGLETIKAEGLRQYEDWLKNNPE